MPVMRIINLPQFERLIKDTQRICAELDENLKLINNFEFELRASDEVIVRAALSDITGRDNR